MTAVNAERTMLIQIEAAKNLLSGLRDQGIEDDAELVADTIEGETNLMEAIDAALSEIDECEILIAGLDEKIKAFDARKKAQKDRAERVRALIEQALVMTDQTSLKLPSATISLAKRAPGLVITNEADIPTRFWIEQERPAPKLDKKALAEALKANEEIPGATLDSGSLSLTVRRR
ncbi:siphovirus Gp157 family protein [Neorhizobium sp. CSC1952]|uniref:siphovirus Gp157 family protein n=1 Tax=Neorhizobium sp. CSC1952 TaxID=2978974 RepID=UPI0025A63CBE|nr:siphovirus Gp157 family protein [Rhizobium sp. CSC1952]WJR66994.1 siphovirus Gp157 family protein [Rhizobium sp. CSC1952]